MRETSKSRWVVVCLAAVYVVWGSTYLAMRVVVEQVPPFQMAAARFLLVGTVLLLFLRVRGQPWPTQKEWLWATPVGCLMFVCGNGTVGFAEKHLSSGIAAVVCATMPLWTAALGPLFGERTSGREFVGMALGFAGVAILGFGNEMRGEPIHAAVLMVAPLAWALGSLLARKLPLARGLMSAATQMISGGALMALVSVGLGEPLPSQLSTKVILSWLYLCLFGSLLAYSAYTFLLRETRPAVATSYSYVNPVIAVLMGHALGGETLGPEVVGALVLIVAATVLVVISKRSFVTARTSSPLASKESG